MASKSNPLAGLHAVYDTSRWQFFIDGYSVTLIPKDLMFKVTANSVLFNVFIFEDNLKPLFKGH